MFIICFYSSFYLTLIFFAFIDNALTTKWLNRLRATANNSESMDQQSQLQCVLDYFNRTSTGTANLAKIDWEGYQSNIHTPNVVKNIRAKYD